MKMDAHNAGELGLWLTMACILMWAYGFTHWNSFRFTNKCKADNPMCYSKIWYAYPHLKIWYVCIPSFRYNLHSPQLTWSLGLGVRNGEPLGLSMLGIRASLPSYIILAIFCKPTQSKVTRRADASWTSYLILPVIFCKPAHNKITCSSGWRSYILIPFQPSANLRKTNSMQMLSAITHNHPRHPPLNDVPVITHHPSHLL